MKKRIENIKKQYKTESEKLLFVVLGFVSGRAFAKGVEWLSTKYPQIEPYAKYASPVILTGGGWILSAATSNEEVRAKHYGYGLVTAGAFEGINLIPVAKEYLGGVSASLGSTYYTENDQPLELGDFGINALPMNSMEMQEAPKVNIDLPPLENGELGYNTTYNENLGYNTAQNELNGSEKDEDDLSGII